MDPDSFVACEQPHPSGTAADSYYIPTWDDATTLSNEQLLGVFTDPTANGGIAFFLMDGENNKKITIPNTISGFPKLVGIAAAGEKDGNELLYGITSNRELYSFTLTKSADGDLSIGEYTALGNSDFPSHDNKNRYFARASLLYDTASGYLLAAVTYFSTASGELGKDDIGSALYLIDPAHPSDYVTVTQLDGVVLNSLYQYEQKSTEGVQLYLSENAISLKAGENADLPTVDAYSYSTDSEGLVTNRKLGDDAVEWTSDNESVLTITATADGKSITASKNVTKQTTVTLTATATAHEKTATKTVTVTVNPDTGSKVGALIAVSSGKADYVWATIDLEDIVDANGVRTFQTVTSDVELVNATNNTKTYWPGGGYAQRLLWGNYYSGSSSNSYYYTLDATYVEETVSETNKDNKEYHDSGRRIADLTDSPEISEGISHNSTTTAAKELARAVFVNEGGNIAWLTGNGTRDSLASKSLESPYSAIAYVGDLKAEQVKGVSSLQCDLGSTCHVYYALKKDGTLNQVILVPRVGELTTMFDHRYSLSETPIGKVTFVNDGSTTTSMDFLWKDADHYGLLVARADKSIQYIELKGHTSGTALTASLVGNLTGVTLKNGSTTGVNGVSALYHKGDVTLSDKQILSIAGWGDVQSPQSAPMAAPAISVLSDEDVGTPAEEPTTTGTITVPITANQPATNGKWTVTYPAGKMTLDTVSKDAGIVYYKFYDDGTGTVTLAFASRDAIAAKADLFTLTFMAKENQTATTDDVTVTCDELNQPAKTPSGGGGGGGGGGGSTGTDSAVTLPSGVTGGSISSSTDKAKPGDTVTITVEPDEGYVPGTVKVVDKDGKEIAVKDLGNGKYSFVMPTGKVDVQVTFAPATGGFTDVSADAYYREAVLWAVEKGVTNGVSDTLFGPDQTCTRAQSVTFLFRALDGTAGTGSSFTDVPADAWYAAAVAWAVEKGVTNGISESQFGPDGDCTRAQIVTFLWRAMK